MYSRSQLRPFLHRVLAFTGGPRTFMITGKFGRARLYTALRASATFLRRKSLCAVQAWLSGKVSRSCRPVMLKSADDKTREQPVQLARPAIDKDNKFGNPWEGWQETKLAEVFYYIFFERKGFSGSLGNTPNPSAAQIKAAFPVRKPDYVALHNPPADAVQALWIGHASLLVQLSGVTFLTDPVISSRASPLSFAGPQRLVPPPLDFDDPQLPRIDFVVISHDHYDHLDVSAVQQLHRRFGAALTWYVPLKLGKWFVSCGIDKHCVVELDWWQSVMHKDSKVTVALTPAQHWSNRGFGRRKSLWGGYAVFTNKLRFYFAGDTGYCPVFKSIGEMYGPFDLAAIPIGAYEPRRLMAKQHVNPAEAVRIHQEVRSKRSIGIHCCTYVMTEEPVDEPPSLLIKEAAKAGLQADEFVTLQHGGMILTSAGIDRAVSPLLGTRSVQ